MKNGRKLKNAQKRLKNATGEKMGENKELSLVNVLYRTILRVMLFIF